MFGQKLKINLFFTILITAFIFSNHIILKAETRKKVKTKGSFLWKVESDSTQIWLLGSIHIGKAEMYPMPDFIENAYKTSDYLALEIDLNKVNPMELMELMTIKDSTTLQDKLSKVNYKKLKDIFDSMKLPEMAYSKFKPWAAIMTAEQLKFKNNGEEGGKGIDMYFMEKANADKKDVYELETVKSQMTLFEEFDKISDEYCNYTLSKIDSNSDSDIDALYEVYIKGDDKKIEELMNEGVNDFPSYSQLMEKLLYKRNQNMAKKIKEWLNTKKTYFVVVGTAHLLGDRSIISLLKQSKFKVERIYK